MDFDRHCDNFFKMLEKKKIKRLLNLDVCRTIADKYHLASVFYILLKANLEDKHYNEHNFHVALHLSHDIHEDNEGPRAAILENLFTPFFAQREYNRFMEAKVMLLIKINYDVLVDNCVCEQLFVDSLHYIWKRSKTEDHGGVTRRLICAKCGG